MTIQIQLELTFLLIKIEIPGLWHFKAHDVLFPYALKLLSKGGSGQNGPKTGPDHAIAKLRLQMLYQVLKVIIQGLSMPVLPQNAKTAGILKIFNILQNFFFKYKEALRPEIPNTDSSPWLPI